MTWTRAFTRQPSEHIPQFFHHFARIKARLGWLRVRACVRAYVCVPPCMRRPCSLPLWRQSSNATPAGCELAWVWCAMCRLCLPRKRHKNALELTVRSRKRPTLSATLIFPSLAAVPLEPTLSDESAMCHTRAAAACAHCHVVGARKIPFSRSPFLPLTEAHRLLRSPQQQEDVHGHVPCERDSLANGRPRTGQHHQQVRWEFFILLVGECGWWRWCVRRVACEDSGVCRCNAI